MDTPVVETAETHKAVAGGSRKELVRKVLQMKIGREAYAAVYEMFVDAVKPEKLIVVAADEANAKGKQQQEGQREEQREGQVVAVFPTVPYRVVL